MHSSCFEKFRNLTFRNDLSRLKIFIVIKFMSRWTCFQYRCILQSEMSSSPNARIDYISINFNEFITEKRHSFFLPINFNSKWLFIAIHLIWCVVCHLLRCHFIAHEFLLLSIWVNIMIHEWLIWGIITMPMQRSFDIYCEPKWISITIETIFVFFAFTIIICNKLWFVFHMINHHQTIACLFIQK